MCTELEGQVDEYDPSEPGFSPSPPPWGLWRVKDNDKSVVISVRRSLLPFACMYSRHACAITDRSETFCVPTVTLPVRKHVSSPPSSTVVFSPLSQ